MQIRMHRGSLIDSMETACCIDGSLSELRAYLADNGCPTDVADRIKVEWYAYDPRIDWRSYIVTVNGCAVAFTDRAV